MIAAWSLSSGQVTLSPSCGSSRHRVGARLRQGLRGVGLGLGLFVAACGTQRDEGPVVARVGDVVLTVAQLHNQVPDSEMAEEQRRLYIDSWVRRELLYQEALVHEVD
ncbi:MAG: hypothetical protein O2782_23765, partial [bacterium]|nr:hypothetical protein [bacterium]